MFNVMNENEMMNVNGGFYYVPSYKIVWSGHHYYRKYVGTVQVSSGSGITCYIDGRPCYS